MIIKVLTEEYKGLPIDIEMFDKRQKDIIKMGLRHGFSKDMMMTYAKPEFSADQMHVIFRGLSDGLSVDDVMTYADPTISEDDMLRMYDRLVHLKCDYEWDYAWEGLKHRNRY